MLSCPAGVITSSRDRTAKVWVQKTGSHEFDLTMTLYGHTDYVNAIAYIPRGLVAGLPHGALVTGEHGTWSLSILCVITVQKLSDEGFWLSVLSVPPMNSN